MAVGGRAQEGRSGSTPKDARKVVCVTVLCKCVTVLRSQSNRLDYQVSFSPKGGMDVEEHWDELITVTLQDGEPLTSERAAPLTAGLPLEVKPAVESFIIAVFQVFL